MSKTINYKKLNLIFKDFSICTEIPIKFKKLGYRVYEIPSIERARTKGVSKVNALYDGIKILHKTLSLIFQK